MLIAWRHPRPRGSQGRCIGARTDLPVDPRKAKRLAHRIRRVARREGLARVVAVSPLRRCRDVGRWLRRWGFRCIVDARLIECDFGNWDGRRWDDIARAEIDAWAANLHDHRPGGGESVAMLLERVRAVRRDAPAGLVVTHGGWLSGFHWLRGGDGQRADAGGWPAAPGFGEAERMG